MADTMLMINCDIATSLLLNARTDYYVDYALSKLEEAIEEARACKRSGLNKDLYYADEHKRTTITKAMPFAKWLCKMRELVSERQVLLLATELAATVLEVLSDQHECDCQATLRDLSEQLRRNINARIED